MWVHDEWHASAALLHARPMPRDGRRRVSWMRPTAPALILGSASPDLFGGMQTELVRRHSGGGLVWLDPGTSAWVDVFVPTGDPLWHSDVGKAFHWLGRTLAAAFADVGLPASMHPGPYEAGPSEGLLCFGSLGPGEVVVDGRKLVGVSQRRTREGSRFQCVAYERFELGPLASVVDAATAARALDRATGWADLGLAASPSGITEQIISFITARDTH
ncbi:lipoyl protein ligase domain-containing protein [Candidatus Poriferisodalis sp.]|uniref:lipoyl protein ligase domain-containing protein n=1 Tax=Candidatus Poriferisodalis sp. TaxID=3101277 RepID=UPI003B01C0E6